MNQFPDPVAVARTRWRWLVGALAVLCVIAWPVLGGASDDPDRRWLEQLDRPDREYLDELVGHAPPAFTADLEWHGTEPLAWDELRGRVVVLQSWTTKTTPGRNAPRRTLQGLDGIEPSEVQLIALHTPDGAGTAATFLERRPLDMPVVVDHVGVFCDELGVYKRPVNIVVDRNGAVRFVGLNAAGLERAVATLVAEPHDATISPPPWTPREATAPADVDFPSFGGPPPRHAVDLRGKPAPKFHVEKWLTANPLSREKVVVVDFWATWCGPCVAAIPHMNELADTFRDDAAFIGLSDEDPAKFSAGLERRRLTQDSFRYALALDPSGKMKQAIQIRAIPHALVVSSDGIVRWQGHPMGLTTDVMRQIVAANQALAGGGGNGRYRWTGG